MIRAQGKKSVIILRDNFARDEILKKSDTNGRATSKNFKAFFCLGSVFLEGEIFSN